MNRWDAGGADQDSWHSILAGPEPLTDLVIGGSGKDADILIAFADGRDLSMGAGRVTVSADSSVQARFTRLDDVNVEIRYRGPGLVARSVRVKCDFCSAEYRPEFQERLGAWPASDSSFELEFCVDADIVLAGDGGGL